MKKEVGVDICKGDKLPKNMTWSIDSPIFNPTVTFGTGGNALYANTFASQTSNLAEVFNSSDNINYP
jgi:hypothetical protein